jgi:hypothetical protein
VAVETYKGAFARGGEPSANAALAKDDPAALANVAAQARATAIDSGATREQAEAAAGKAIETYKSAFMRTDDPNTSVAGGDPSPGPIVGNPNTAFSGGPATALAAATEARAAAIDSGATPEQGEAAARMAITPTAMKAYTGAFGGASDQPVGNQGAGATIRGFNDTGNAGQHVQTTGVATDIVTGYSGTRSTVSLYSQTGYVSNTVTGSVDDPNALAQAAAVRVLNLTSFGKQISNIDAQQLASSILAIANDAKLPDTVTNTIDTPEDDAAAIANATAVVQAALLLAEQKAAQPNITIDDVSVFEEGTVAEFTVSLSHDQSPSTITVEFATAVDTATPGVDFVATKGTLTFAPGDRTKTFSVPIISDSNDENNEKVILNLQLTSDNANITDTSGTLTIVDNDVNLTTNTDFSGKSFSDSGSLVLATGIDVRQTVTVATSTEFGSSKLVNFVTGPGITTDVFDYNDALLSGNGTPIPVLTPLALTEIANSGTPKISLGTTIISNDSNAVIDLETSSLSVDFTGSSSSLLADIVRAAEDLLESTDPGSNLTQTNSPVTNGRDNTDSLLVFYEASGQGPTQDAVIIRYQEGAADAPFDNELGVVAIFEGISSGSFDSANFV